jgi:hypothetical protein
MLAGMIIHVYHPRTWEVEGEGFEFEARWVTQQVPNQPWLYKESLSKKSKGWGVSQL